jgi:hypothetical protein
MPRHCILWGNVSAMNQTIHPKFQQGFREVQ